MADEAAAGEIIPFPRPSDQMSSWTAVEQHQILTTLSTALAQSLRVLGRVEVAASDEFERGLVRDAVLIAATKLDRNVTGRATPDNTVLITISEDDDEPYGARFNSTGTHGVERKSEVYL